MESWEDRYASGPEKETRLVFGSYDDFPQFQRGVGKL